MSRRHLFAVLIGLAWPAASPAQSAGPTPSKAPSPGALNGGERTAMIFGNSVTATRLGVILDVSASVQPHVAGAVDEIQKGFPDAILILYPGCGMMQFDGDPEHRVRKFSSIPRSAYEGNRDLFTTAAQIQNAVKIAGFESMTRRSSVQETLFVSWYDSRKGTQPRLIGRTQVAFEDLIGRRVDAIYWFSDFADAIDPRVADRVGKQLKANRIKLHLHNFAGNRFNDEAKALAEKTGGTMISSKP